VAIAATRLLVMSVAITTRIVILFMVKVEASSGIINP
jgi:hypothetical protein